MKEIVKLSFSLPIYSVDIIAITLTELAFFPGKKVTNLNKIFTGI